MRRIRKIGAWGWFFVLGGFLIWTAPVRAQSDAEANGGVQFNFSNPGARSLALGGAFLGSVDDATAAYANPAGLLQLSEPEVFVEGRRWSFSTPFADRGRASGVPTGNGIDTLGGVELGIAESEVDGLSFASFVYPRPKWAIAAFFHQAAEFESDFSTSGIFSQSGSDTFRLFPVRSSYSLDISQIGFALAGRWNNVSVGLGVSKYGLELDSLTERFTSPDREFFSPPNFSRDRAANFQIQSGDAEEIGLSLGLQWDVGSKTTLGMVYRFGPEFEIDLLSVAGSPQRPLGSIVDATGTFDLPDFLGIGWSFRPVQSFTIHLDVHQIRFSDLTRSFVVFFDEVQEQSVQPEDFVIDDVTEVHLGFEYVFGQSPIPLAVRLGAWHDPDHRLRAEAGPVLNQARFFPGEDQIHATAGLGFVFTSHVQLDLGVDLSDTVDTFAISTAYRF